VAAAAAIIWLVAVVSTVAFSWHSTGTQGFSSGSGVFGPTGPSSLWRFVEATVESLNTSWGYALVAALAYVGSVWLDNEYARDLFDVLDRDRDEDD
jgi:hypothetical protein